MSAERLVEVGRGITLCCEERGDPAAPLVLLVMGLGLDLSWWKDDLCDEVAARGLRVVRFDNRDVGRSTHVPGPGVSALGFLRRRATPVYTLGDMADDAAGLIDRLGGGPAHVVGVSLGSMIAQEIAIRHADRTASLTSIMGRPGDGRTGKVARTKMLEFLRPAPRDPVEGMVQTFRRIGSDGRTEQDDDDTRHALVTASRRERGDGSGSGRQLAAIIAERDRTPDLRRLTMPAFVLHGTKDRVILPSGGRATAAAIGERAELLELEGMGHDLPRWVWPHLVDGLGRTVARA